MTSTSYKALELVRCKMSLSLWASETHGHLFFGKLINNLLLQFRSRAVLNLALQ